LTTIIAAAIASQNDRSRDNQLLAFTLVATSVAPMASGRFPIFPANVRGPANERLLLFAQMDVFDPSLPIIVDVHIFADFRKTP
jgi:hypothetical protein